MSAAVDEKRRGFSHESPRNESIEWYTPPKIFDALGVRFDLDPCSPGAGKSFVPADRHLTIDDDGLEADWDPEHFAFVNPPYGTATQHWMQKLAQHGNGIALVFARTDVQWFQDIAPLADSICFVSGRIRFYQGTIEGGEPSGRPGAGSMLLGFGTKARAAIEQSGLGISVRVQP